MDGFSGEQILNIRLRRVFIVVSPHKHFTGVLRIRPYGHCNCGRLATVVCQASNNKVSERKVHITIVNGGHSFILLSSR